MCLMDCNAALDWLMSRFVICEDFQLSRMMMIYWNIMAVVMTSKCMILTTTLSAIIIFVIMVMISS